MISHCVCSFRALCATVWLSVMLMICCTTSAIAGVFDGLDRSSSARYAVRLTEGELLIGSIADIVDDAPEGKAIKLKTAIGVALIYETQVVEIIRMDDYYRHAHRILFMPTAEPISGDHYVGNAELFALWAGFGIGDIGSVSLIRTIIPSISSHEQISSIDLKATVYSEEYTTMPGKFTIALGANLGWINDANRITDVYVSTTFTRIRSRITAMVFGNISGYHSDVFTATAGTFGNVLVHYPSGAVGFGIGLDTRFPGRQDLHLIAELWNGNLESANNSAFVLGLRLANSTVALDFGMAVLTAPYFIPVTSFSWTPF